MPTDVIQVFLFETSICVLLRNAALKLDGRSCRLDSSRNILYSEYPLVFYLEMWMLICMLDHIKLDKRRCIDLRL